MKLNNNNKIDIFKFEAGGKNSNHVQSNTRAAVFIYVEPHKCVCVCVFVCVCVCVCEYVWL
jgi:hypothetical protein